MPKVPAEKYLRGIDNVICDNYTGAPACKTRLKTIGIGLGKVRGVKEKGSGTANK